jgi:hypothetical protein
MEWNANGLLRHQHELEVILSTENNDLYILSEKHFAKESFIRFKNYITYHTVTCLTKGNDRMRDTAGNNCKLVYNRIRDTVAPYLVTVTIGLYGYEAKNGMRGYVATGESALEVSLRQLVSGSRRGQSSSVSRRVRREHSAVPSAGFKKPRVPKRSP